MRHPTARTRSSVTRWRAGLAGMLAAALAVIGAAVGIAAPAAADEIPASTLEIVTAACSSAEGGPGLLEYVVDDPYPAYRDFITVTDSGGNVVHEAVYLDEVDLEQTRFEASVQVGLGTFTIAYSVERETGGSLIDTQTFTITCPDLDIDDPITTCSTGADGTATFGFTGLIEGEQYAYFVEGIGVSTFDEFIAGGPSHEAAADGLPPGNYYVYAQWQNVPIPVYDWRGFAVEPCQPEVTIEVTECTVPGGTGSALVTLSNLVAGVEYDVRVTDRGDADGTPYGGVRLVTADEHGAAQLSVSKLPPGQDFTVWIAGVWTTTPWEEPPFLGGGNFTPIESLDLVGHADFSVKPCSVATTTKPALAATGVDGVVPLVTGALVLLGLGGAALLVARRRRAASRNVS